MKKKLSPEAVFKRLSQLYPDAGCTLDWTTPLELLVATILSAQCTDKRVNIVTTSLFKKYRTPNDYIAVAQSELENDIHSCGTFRMKAKAIRETCRTLLKDFDGKVPRSMKEMITLRGVGRKTASVVLSTAYGINEGIAVDTHVTRVARRLGLTRSKTQSGIEKDLMKKFPQKYWASISHLLIFHGRKACTARVKCQGMCLTIPHPQKASL